MLDMAVFAKRLKVARLTAGLSQQKAADMAGIGRLAVVKAEAGMTMPSTYTTVMLANVYGVSVEWLFGLDVGETVTFFDNERQLQALTGLSHDGLWNAGFDLDDWDYGFVTNEEWDDPDRECSANSTFYQWHLPMLISNNCCEFTHREWKGRHYYMRYHA